MANGWLDQRRRLSWNSLHSLSLSAGQFDGCRQTVGGLACIQQNHWRQNLTHRVVFVFGAQTQIQQRNKNKFYLKTKKVFSGVPFADGLCFIMTATVGFVFIIIRRRRRNLELCASLYFVFVFWFGLVLVWFMIRVCDSKTSSYKRLNIKKLIQLKQWKWNDIKTNH